MLQDTANSDRARGGCQGCDLLIHEATYENQLWENAIEHGHSTSGMAGRDEPHSLSLSLTHPYMYPHTHPHTSKNTATYTRALLLLLACMRSCNVLHSLLLPRAQPTSRALKLGNRCQVLPRVCSSAGEYAASVRARAMVLTHYSARYGTSRASYPTMKAAANTTAAASGVVRTGEGGGEGEGDKTEEFLEQEAREAWERYNSNGSSSSSSNSNCSSGSSEAVAPPVVYAARDFLVLAYSKQSAAFVPEGYDLALA